jgi:hypothetical protein
VNVSCWALTSAIKCDPNSGILFSAVLDPVNSLF